MGILKGYVNKENNSNRIYSREDVGKMSTAEYSKNEKAIDHQMRTVGVPSNNDLKNSSDVVYVSAYKRADGTEVSAYYRSKPDGIGSNNSSNPGDLVAPTDQPTGGDLVPDGSNPIDKILNLLTGGYTVESILPTDGESPLGKISSDNVFKLSATKTDYPDVNTEVLNVQISNAIDSIMNNSQNASNFNVSDAPQFRASSNNLNTSIEAIKKVQTVQKNNLDNLLQKVTTAKNQDEYSKLLKEYAKQKEQYQKTQGLAAQIEHSLQKGNSQSLAQTAQNYTQQGSEMQPVNQKLTREHYNNKLDALINNALGIQPASAEEMPTGFASGVGNTAKNKNILSQLSELEMQRDKRNIGNINSLMKNDNPNINKFLLDKGIPTMNHLGGNTLNDSTGLWETASDNFQNTDYINKNADVVNSISDFGNNELSKQISNKLQSQFGIKDAKGLVFYPNSELSTEMSNSPEIRDFISKNKNILNSGKIIKNSSVSFNSNKDLYFGIHNADIINAKINQNGDFQAIVLDTYDFNKNSTNPLVKMARNVQDAKMLKPYYTINFVYIPGEKLQKYYGFN